jgi:hypothetical protein
VEWPAAGSDALPAPDVRIELEHRTLRTRTAKLAGPAALEAAVAAGAAAEGGAVPVVAAVATAG